LKKYIVLQGGRDGCCEVFQNPELGGIADKQIDLPATDLGSSTSNSDGVEHRAAIDLLTYPFPSAASSKSPNCPVHGGFHVKMRA
jgi:hypothetical protein